MTGSRLVYDHQGPRFCIGADGCVWRVLHLAAVMGFEPPGRLPDAREMLMTRSPYTSVVGARRERQRQVVPDDELNERAALEACRREQQREPADLVGRVAA